MFMEMKLRRISCNASLLNLKRGRTRCVVGIVVWIVLECPQLHGGTYTPIGDFTGRMPLPIKYQLAKMDRRDVCPIILRY